MADDRNLEKLLHAGSNRITENVFSKVAKQNPGKSVVVSAFSVMTPLAQLALASVGPSHEELLNAIGLPNDNVTKAVFYLIDKNFKFVQGIELKTANKIYIPLEYELNPEFVAVSRIFHSEIANINFLKNEAAAKEINAWVEDQTNHRIKNLINPENLSINTQTVLVNALYFKGTWMSRFGEHFTRESDFHITKEKVAKIPMMHNRADYKYGESQILKSKILEMPYVGNISSMLIVLPDEIDGIENLLEKLKDLSILDKESKNLYNVEVEVYIPKFKIETTTDLKEILPTMNVQKLFIPDEAKLDKLLKTAANLYVSDAIQKAFIEVNEEGAEATVANNFGVKSKSSKKEYLFVADHPFAFFLKINDNIMFSGIYYAT